MHPDVNAFLELAPGVKLLLFENYGLLQRPQDGILKALERVDWVQYNMPLEVLNPITSSSYSHISRHVKQVDMLRPDFNASVGPEPL